MLLQGDPIKRGKKGKLIKIFATVFLIFFLSSSFLFMAPAPARANLPVVDLLGNALTTGKTIWDKIQNVLKVLLVKVAGSAVESALSNTLKTIVYDEATYLGTGREGQKPLWETGNIGTIMGNIGDNAAGNFISQLEKQFGVNLCQPSLPTVKLSIGLGLVGAKRPPQPDCTASTMVKNWDATLKAFASQNRQDFLKQFAGIFDVTGGKSDLSAALSIQSGFIEAQATATANKQLSMLAGSAGLMLDNRNVAGTVKGIPGKSQQDFNNTMAAEKASLMKSTQSDLSDLVSIFIKQLSITGIQTIMKKFTESLNQPAANSSISNPYAAPQSGGIAAAQGVLRKIIEPQFSSKADYDILQQLSVCNVGVLGGVGPTDCVIDDSFSQAISNRKTVGQAFVNDTKPFGFIAGSANNSAPIEPSYTQGYPYRSMSILRKYRIIPVGWELAAQYIEAHPEVISGNHNNLKSLIACYDPNDLYRGYNDNGDEKWCQGLVDPTWVLKAPQNYCSKQGYGPQILSGQSVSGGVDADGKALQTEFQVVRSDSYCGDEKSCIKENDDGSCKYFGYCTEDKRLWKFGASGSCDAQYNTCQTFTDSQGGRVSYLKNSIQFCDQINAGCHEYAIAAPEGYNSATENLDWTKSPDSVFLNKSAKTCDQSNEGCHEFLRFSSGLGTNLIINSDFSLDTDGNAPAHWPADVLARVSGANPGGHSGNVVQINSNSPEAFYTKDWSASAAGFISAFPAGFVMQPEVSYTLSAEVNLQSGDSVTIGIGRRESTWKEARTKVKGWQPLSITLLNNNDILANEIRIYGTSANGTAVFYVANIKFEVSTGPTAYSAYRGNNLVYEKFMPDYLRDACYADPANGDFRLKDKLTRPSACDNFARQCNADEVGCDSYTRNDNPGQQPIPAAITEVDNCPAKCVGYNTYIQSQNNFTTAHVKYFIPSTAKACSAASVGCQEFTNLASSTAGGERKEYYSYLRQCVKPTDQNANCGDFYAWEGSGTGGQQLVKYSLKTNGGAPAVTSDDQALCNPFVYGLNPLNPAANADCRQFYDNQGNISFHLYSRTISCSSNCSVYRLTKKDKLDNINNSADCAGGNWDDAAQACYVCKNGGTWNANQNACVYQALPAGSAACSAADNGCAEYNGNSGANTQNVFYNDFENGTADGWSGGYGASVNTSAYIAGTHSFSFTSDIVKTIGASAVVPGSSYVLTFLAKTDNVDVTLSAELNNQTGGGVLSFDKSVTVKPSEWRIYSLSLPVVNQIVAAGETLTIKVVSGSDQIYLDNIQLMKISDRYYLVDGSWKTPAVCDQDTNGNAYPLFTLGCASYNNLAGQTKYLHSFDHICQASAAGCEAIIDTQNTDSADADISHGATTTIAADRVVNVVYDQNLLCDKTNQGCERLGLKKPYAGQSTFQDTYVLNNPQLYSSTLCSQRGVGCDLYTYTLGAGQSVSQAYFKDPGDQVCEWRQSPGVASNNGWGWYKKKVTKCGGVAAGEVCVFNKDCPTGSSCALEKTDTPCPTEKLKTIGSGGLGNEVFQPGSDGIYQWTGLCPDTQSSCAEYIDPVSDFSGNQVANADFSQHIGSLDVADDWEKTSGIQNINLEGGTLYVLAVEGQNTATLDFSTFISGVKPFHVLQTDNSFAPAIEKIQVGPDSSELFYTDNTIKEIKVANVAPRANGNQSTIILRKAIVNYHLSEGADGVDNSSCTQGANPSAGCVFFNERSATVSGTFKPLDPGPTIDPWASYGITGINSGAINLANGPLPLKVNPDRDCAQWLACKSYIKDENTDSNVCFDIANCNRLDDSGSCANFTVLADNQTGNRIFPTSTAENIETIKNLTGYVRVGFPTVNPLTDLRDIPDDLLNPGVMAQVGANVIIPNGDFELATVTSTPINAGVNWIGNPSNWTPAGGGKWSRDTADSLYSVISDPETAQNYSFFADRQKSANTYPMIGKSFLRYNATNRDGTSPNFPKSDVIYVQSGKDYYLSFYVDTFSLKTGSDLTPYAQVSILDGNGKVIDSVTQDYQDGWILKTQKFRATSKTIRLLLGATASSSGNVYIDDIEITPVLLARQASNYHDATIGSGQSANIPALYDRQTCRLYPQENSLACDYYDSAGILQKGDRGYCLQYDRFPGDPNACILWWPIDKVKGAGIQTGQAKGYSGRAPLYYCTKSLYTDLFFTPADFKYFSPSQFDYKITTNNGAGFGKIEGNINPEPSCCSIVCSIFSSIFGFVPGLADLFDTINFEHPEKISSDLSTIISDGGNDKPLNYGTNYIQVTLIKNDLSCLTKELPSLFQFSGKYHYKNGDQTVTKSFDFVQMFKDLQGKSCGNGTCAADQEQIHKYSDGSTFQVLYSCGTAANNAHDNGVQVKLIGSQEFINYASCTGGDKFVRLTYTFNAPSGPACAQIANVVNIDGQNKAWAERVRQGSSYAGATCNKNMPPAFFNASFDPSPPVFVPAPTTDPAVISKLIPIDPPGSPGGSSCSSVAASPPFGSANSPAGDLSDLSDPAVWKNALPYWSLTPEESAINGSMGQLYDKTDLSYLFAQSNGIWNWDSTKGYYVKAPDTENWSAPANRCDNNVRSACYQYPAYGVAETMRHMVCIADHTALPDCLQFLRIAPPLGTPDCNCAVAPTVSNISLNSAGSAYIYGRGFVNLTFNSQVDSEQAPLVSYSIDWGDGLSSALEVSGADMNPRPPGTPPHSAYHAYDYYDLLNKYNKGESDSDGFKTLPTLECKDSIGQCVVKPRVKIVDNWGWCSEGVTGNPCPTTDIGNTISGLCMNSAGSIENPARRCWSNSTIKNGSKICTNNNYPYCGDGWYESSGQIIVYKQ
ncbi:MAG: hypothetical protein PHE24_01040 [Patescibacteria group bacterium]|nr:hypothetical protein [Patescibacteria group bacterium]